MKKEKSPRLPNEFNKIMIFGLPGSGKSTFAAKLGRGLNLPIYHLDRYFYLENWVERDYKEFLGIQKSFVDQPQWVIDGNAMQSLELRFQKADVAIYFHFPVFVCLWRILKRVFQNNWHIPDLAEGCTKSFHFKLIKYMFQYHKRYGPKMDELRRKYPKVSFYIFNSDTDAESFLDTLTQNQLKMNLSETLGGNQ